MYEETNGLTLLSGEELVKGYRISFQNDESPSQEERSLHICGGYIEGDLKEINCPHCATVLFPVFKLNFLDLKLKQLNLWQLPFLQVLICPFCFMGFKPYWIHFSENTIDLTYEDFDHNLLPSRDDLNFEYPYGSKPVFLVDLTAEDYPTSLEIAYDFMDRIKPPGVYHQIGGFPPTGIVEQMNCCKCDQAMPFAGIVDSDIGNIPLYLEGHVMKGLEIADRHSYYFFTCKTCNVVGMKRVV